MKGFARKRFESEREINSVPTHLFKRFIVTALSGSGPFVFSFPSPVWEVETVAA